MAEAQAKKAGLKNEKVGEVVSTKMQKTIVVVVGRRVPHLFVVGAEVPVGNAAAFDRIAGRLLATVRLPAS